MLFDIGIVDIAPAPLTHRLVRIDDRMIRLLEMLSCVRILGRVAAAGVAACHAQAHFHPGTAHLLAVLASLGMRSYVLVNLISMRTSCICHGGKYNLRG